MSKINKKWIEGYGLANGFATLDVDGKLPASQLPLSVMEYKGTWSAATNVPALANGTGNTGDLYQVSAAGSVDFGAGAIAFETGDKVVYNGAEWEKWDMTEQAIPAGQIRYVNGAAGSDATGDGTIKKPYATISAAQNSISDASATKRYAIFVAAGNYTDAIALKANVFVVGASKESVRVTGAVSMGASFSGSADNRSGFSQITLLSAADFNWATVTSAAGKLYMNEVVFGSAVNMYGHNNAIAQAQFNSCIFFGNFTISGINVGVFTNNVCYSNVTLNQHPNGGMATLLVANGGYCSGTIRQTTTVNDFNRRCASFLRNFPSENLIVDGPSSYADFTIDSGSKNGAQSLNGGNLVQINATVSQTIKPNLTNTHYSGDFGKQWFFNFAYVHASTDTDLYLTSVSATGAPTTTGRSIYIQSDGYGVAEDIDGGSIFLQTSNVSGEGTRGKIVLNGKEVDCTSKQVKNVADATDPQDALTKGQLDDTLFVKSETVEITAAMISAKQLSLSGTPKTGQGILVIPYEGLPQVQGVDYNLTSNVISWDGLGMDGIIEEGDTLEIYY